MKAVIMAGGKGTRIRSVASEIPKSMIPILGKPILGYQIENLKNSGFQDIILVTGYLKEYIKEYFRDGSGFGVNIEYFDENEPLGTAGALAQISEKLTDDFPLLMGDVMLSVDFGRFMQAHRASGAMITLFTHPNAHPADSYLIVTDEAGRLEDFTEDICGIGREEFLSLREEAARKVKGFINAKEKQEDLLFHNQVSAGIYAMSPDAIRAIKETVAKKGTQKLDLDSELVRPMIERGRVFAYKSTEYVKDMGTPERYEEVTRDVCSGLVEARNLEHRQPCVFLDRDGTVNEEVGFLTDPQKVKLIPGSAKAIKMLNDSRYLAVLITNQPVVARGEVSFRGLDDIFKTLEMELASCGAYLDGIYFCPHHEHSGFEGEVKELKFACQCRKPRPGMILKAASKLNIDLSSSYMIGDMTGDILCGQNAGLKTVALRTGVGLSDAKFKLTPDMEFDDLLQAVTYILENDKKHDHRKNRLPHS